MTNSSLTWVRAITSHAVITALFAVALNAQRTWIVDQNAGPDHDFVDVGSAIAAAASGDTLIVRPGTYNAGRLDIDKGLSIVGQGDVFFELAGFGIGAGHGIWVHDLSADESFAIRDIDLGGVFAFPELRAERCAGLVTVQGARARFDSQFRPQHMTFEFFDCDQVHVGHVFVRGGDGIEFTRSRGVIEGSVLEGDLAGPLSITDSDVTLDLCSVSSGSGIFSLGPPLVIADSAVRVSRSAIIANAGGAAASWPAIEANGGAVILDPTVSLTPTGSAPPTSGTATFVAGEVVSMDATVTATALSLDVHGRSNALFVTLLSFPTASLHTPWGDLSVNADAHLLLRSGVFSGRADSAQLALAGIPPGLTMVAQTIVFDGDFALSNGIALVFP